MPSTHEMKQSIQKLREEEEKNKKARYWNLFDTSKPKFSEKSKKKEELPEALIFELQSLKFKKDDQKALLADFDKKFGQGNRDIDESLTFPSEEDAMSFLKEQAKLGRSFLFKAEGRNEYAYSDGKGNLFVGTHQALTQHLKSLPRDIQPQKDDREEEKSNNFSMK